MEENIANTIKTIMIFYIDVGQLPPERAEALLYRYKDQFSPILDRLPKSVGTMWFMVRNRPTTVELMQVSN